MRSKISQIDPAHPIVNEGGKTTEQFRIFLFQVQESGLLIGTGAPENNVEAQQGRFYMDDTGPAGAILYIKQLADIGGDRKQGWKPV